MTRARATLALLALSAAFALAAVPATAQAPASPAPAPEPRTSLPDIEDEVMCPICGVPLELAIDAPQAQREREFIRELIAEGATKDEVKDALVVEFGEEVLAVPSAEGFDLAAWLVPGAAILAAGVAILLALRRWRDDGQSAASAVPRRDATDHSETATGAPEEERALEADLARHQL